MALCLFGLPTKVSISFPLAKRTATHTFTKKKKIGKVKIIFFFYLKIKKKYAELLKILYKHQFSIEYLNRSEKVDNKKKTR
jgi:hypothetical protein